jgi:hypothetical protein
MFRPLSVLVLSPAVALVFAAAPTTSVNLEQAGRYKVQGNLCEWDAKDGGPNQCEPIIKGRFKKGDKDACTWDVNAVGADECRPSKGRWKAGSNNACAWDANDGGPDQCNPRRVKK